MECTFLVLIVLLIGCCSSARIFRLANHYEDNMVLQREPNQAFIWGYGEAGHLVYVSINGKTYITMAVVGGETKGTWSLKLDAQNSGGPFILNAWSSESGGRVDVTLKNIMFGDVWFCSGQSNMGFSVSMAFEGAKEIANADKYPDVRLFRVKKHVTDKPVTEISKSNIRQHWSVASAVSVGGSGWDSFSAVCWMYDRRLYDVLKVPIGLIQSAYGGSTIEAWSSSDALAKCNIATPINDNHEAQLSWLWNGMIQPFLKMTIYGVIWYQGETNALNVRNYDCEFSNMVDDWRQKWIRGTLGSTSNRFPFGFVQLSVLGKDLSVYRPKNAKAMVQGFPVIRWQQTARFGYVPNAKLPNTFMAIAMDLPDDNSPHHEVHSRHKTDVAHRLALGAQAVAYNQNVYWTGPIMQKIVMRWIAVRTLLMTVHYKLESIKNFLDVRSKKGFEILLTNKFTKKKTNWIPYDVTTYGTSFVSLRVYKFNEYDVTAVRYNWHQQPCEFKKCAVYSGDLPSPPFIGYGPFRTTI